MEAALLDTHVLIWFAEERSKLSVKAVDALADTPLLYISPVSVWELAIKVKLGKLSLQFELEEFVQNAMRTHELTMLPIALPHIYHTLQLSLHHNDPFDRLLIAQSIVENLPVVSSDEAFDAYPVTRIW